MDGQRPVSIADGEDAPLPLDPKVTAFEDVSVMSAEDRDEEPIWPDLTPAGLQPVLDEEEELHRSQI